MSLEELNIEFESKYIDNNCELNKIIDSSLEEYNIEKIHSNIKNFNRVLLVIELEGKKIGVYMDNENKKNNYTFEFSNSGLVKNDRNLFCLINKSTREYCFLGIYTSYGDTDSSGNFISAMLGTCFIKDSKSKSVLYFFNTKEYCDINNVYVYSIINK